MGYSNLNIKDQKLKAMLKIEAIKQSITLSQLVEKILREYFEVKKR